MPTPEISVVVPSHDRPVRLRWLLNALEEQTLDRSRWEVVVSHDSSGPETEEILNGHPLAADGTLRHATLEPGTAPPGLNRNVAWRLAKAPLIAFTDDDCRPPKDWLANALAAAQRNPGAIVQGLTRSDPDEDNIKNAPWPRTQWIIPPGPWAETCNIVYPREILEQHNGFDETMYVGEDCDLACRARAAGTPYVGAREMRTYHAVDAMNLYRRIRGQWRWLDLVLLFKRHPELREYLTFTIFWKRSHFWLPLAVFGLLKGRKKPAYLALAYPFVVHVKPVHGSDPRGRYRETIEFPAHAAMEAFEFLAMIRGSIKHRSLML